MPPPANRSRIGSEHRRRKAASFMERYGIAMAEWAAWKRKRRAEGKGYMIAEKQHDAIRGVFR